MIGLDLTGFDLDIAWDISADGKTIIGTARDTQPARGDTWLWVATIPEPGTGSLLAASLMGLGVLRRRRATSGTRLA